MAIELHFHGTPPNRAAIVMTMCGGRNHRLRGAGGTTITARQHFHNSIPNIRVSRDHP
jgi:hypothetical protein